MKTRARANKVRKGPKPGRPPEILRPPNETNNKGWVLAGNPTNSPLVPLPSMADLPILVRTTRLRFGYNIEKNDRAEKLYEITVPIDIIRALQLEAGMEMLFQAYGDGRILLSRAGMYVDPEVRDL